MLGVEPDARMADFTRACGLPVEVATFEAWEPAGRAFDTVIAAQSWHWVDPAVGALKAARVAHQAAGNAHASSAARATSLVQAVTTCSPAS
ncbi:hypothetical protein SVIOM342S_07307 [Streptomyces violaceorubidus]